MVSDELGRPQLKWNLGAARDGGRLSGLIDIQP